MDGRVEFDLAMKGNLDAWVPACGGTEIPTLWGGRRYLYCWNPRLRKHAWLDMTNDLILDEAPWAL